MEAISNRDSFDDDVLLKRFTRADFEAAKAKLLERYHLWQGLLVSNDEQSIITPDDLENIKAQAADILGQEIKSEYELEQLKILTVLIYLLIHSTTTAITVNPELQEKLDAAEFPNSRHYIVRKLIHHAQTLNNEEINRLVAYQNLVLGSYITQTSKNKKPEPPRLDNLKTGEGEYFNILDLGYEIAIEFVDAPATEIQLEEIEVPEVEPAVSITPSHIDLSPVIIHDENSDFLINNYHEGQLSCGVSVAASSYIGLDRKHNEDAIAIFPKTDHVLVIDAMGGYGNGVIARDLFVEILLENSGNMEEAATKTQRYYDESNLEQGGVCITGLSIQAKNDYFTVNLAQAGDVHAVVYDPQGELKFETVDESIGHLVINAIIGKKATDAQRNNGWKNFGILTKTSLRTKPGWRMAVYSDGIGNHFKAKEMAELILNKTRKQAIASISKVLDEKMRVTGAYKDNSSIAIIDF